MTVSNVASQVYGMGQGVVSFVCNTSVQAGKVFSVLNKDVQDLETAIMLGKVGDVVITAKETLGFGKATSSEKAYQGVVGTLDGWNALKTFPDAVLETKEKVSDFFIKKTYAIAMDCVSAVTGLFNATCDVVGFLENQLALPFFKGVSDILETSNFQALAAGATARASIAAERVFSYLSGKGGVSDKDMVNNVLDLTKNMGDLGLAVSMLTGANKVALVGASSISAASKLAKYGFSKIV